VITMELSKEYGTALFSLACENKSEEEYGIALENMEKVFKENPEYIEFLSCPSVPMSERINAIVQAFEDNMPEYVVSFLKILCEKGHVRSFFDCFQEYKKLLDASRQTINAKVTSAIELTASEKEQLKHKLEKKSGCSVILECHIDKSLLGGLVIEMDGNLIDGSLRHRLQEVKDVISR